MADEYILKSFDGGAQKTTLTTAFTIGGSTLSVANGSTFPSGSSGPFVVVVDRGLAAEEKFLIDTTSGVNGVIFTIQQAGYDGTTPSNHALGGIVEHCLDAYSIEQANRYANLQTTKGDLITHNGTTTLRVAAGTNNQVLIADSVQAAGIKWGQVQSTGIADGSIVETKIANNAITTNKIGDGQVTAVKIADAAITEVKLATGAVTTTKLADGSVTAAKIAGGAIPTSVPTGVVSSFAGSTAPAGYLLCDGTAVSRTTYADLFAVIGTTYGAGNGSTTFALPDLRSRFVAGKGTGTWSNVLAEAGGSTNAVIVSHAHSGPSHTHSYSTSTAGDHIHNIKVKNNAAAYGSGLIGPSTTTTWVSGEYEPTEGAGSHNHSGSTAAGGTGSTSTEGVSASNANLPPYITLNHIIKT